MGKRTISKKFRKNFKKIQKNIKLDVTPRRDSVTRSQTILKFRPPSSLGYKIRHRSLSVVSTMHLINSSRCDTTPAYNTGNTIMIPLRFGSREQRWLFVGSMISFRNAELQPGHVKGLFLPYIVELQNI
jgi:hypothetical protein